MFRSTTLLLLVFCLFACSGRKVDTVTPKELPSSAAISIDASEQELYDASRQLYERGLYIVAVDTLASLANSYPTGEYVEFAKLKLADSYFHLREYQKAYDKAKDFLDNFPGSSSEAYVTYLAAKSSQMLFGGEGRDLTPLAIAGEHYQDIVQRFPDSEFHEVAKNELVKINANIAHSRKRIIDFYKDTGHAEAAKIREQQLSAFYEKHQTKLEKSSQADIQEGVALEQAAELSYAQNLVAALPKEDSRSNSFLGSEITKLACRSLPNKLIEVHFASLDYSALRDRLQSFTPEGDQLKLFSSSGNKTSQFFDCFSQQAEFTTSGTLRFAGLSSFNILAVDNPVRLLLVQE